MKKGWSRNSESSSLPEVFSSIAVPKSGSFWQKLFAFAGPGLMVAVGYMDPGNWATGIAGGAQFSYALLWVILISNLFAMVLQHLALKLGIVAERDLAQACRDHFSPKVNLMLWLFCEVAIAACDLAEVIGSAIALNLLFGIPVMWGIIITIIDVLLILLLQAKGFRWLEAVVAVLILTIIACFGYEIVMSNPEVAPLLHGFLPQKQILFDSEMLYIACAILGATVMPHNLYLHSSIVQTRNYDRSDAGKREAVKFATIDSTVSLFLAFFINASILIVAAATFHKSGYTSVADITDAHKMLAPILGTGVASVVFAVALLASGQNSTLTGTLAGQIVMEGFLNIRLKPWLRRLITRLVAVVPAVAVTYFYGEKGTADLLIFSQVILSMQLSFAVIPLVMFTGDRSKMGSFVNSRKLSVISWSISTVIVILNIFLLYRTFFN